MNIKHKSISNEFVYLLQVGGPIAKYMDQIQKGTYRYVIGISTSKSPYAIKKNV